MKTSIGCKLCLFVMIAILAASKWEGITQDNSPGWFKVVSETNSIMMVLKQAERAAKGQN